MASSDKDNPHAEYNARWGAGDEGCGPIFAGCGCLVLILAIPTLLIGGTISYNYVSSALSRGTEELSALANQSQKDINKMSREECLELISKIQDEKTEISKNGTPDVKQFTELRDREKALKTRITELSGFRPAGDLAVSF